MPLVLHVSRVALVAYGLESIVILEVLPVTGVSDDGLEVVLRDITGTPKE